MFHPRFARSIRLAAATAILSIGPACDDSTPVDDTTQEIRCNLADAACTALPAAADAIAVLESMDVDLDEAVVELIVHPAPDGRGDPADEPPAPNTLVSIDPEPQALKSSCNGDISRESYWCCCYWDGWYWGCECY